MAITDTAYLDQLGKVNPVGWFTRNVTIHMQEIEPISSSFVKNCHPELSSKTAVLNSAQV